VVKFQRRIKPENSENNGAEFNNGVRQSAQILDKQDVQLAEFKNV
jgi:hypothetical protein